MNKHLILSILLFASFASADDFGAETIEFESVAVEESGEPANLDGEFFEVPEIEIIDIEPEEETSLADQTTTVFNSRDVEITKLIESVSLITGRTYIVDDSVKGKVTIHVQKEVTVPEALRIMDTVLLLRGFTTVPVGPDVYKVVSAKDAKSSTIPLVSSKENDGSDQLVTQLLRLKHVQASEVQQLLSQFVSGEGIINSFEGTNSLIIIDSGANIQRLERLISEVDVPAVDQDITIIPIRHADANDIAEKIEEILGEDKDAQQEQQAAVSARQAAARRAIANRRNAARNRAASRTTQPVNVAKRTLPVKVIPDERTNSLVVVADEATTDRVKALIEQLDSKVDLSGGRFFVHRLNHADAEELSEVMNNLISGASSEASSNTNASTTGSSLTRNRNLQRTAANTSAAAGAAAAGRVTFEGDVSLAADAATNSLIINASRGDYLRLKSVIDELDAKRPQVIVEATILEVSLDNSEGLGFEWQFTGANDEGGLLGQANYGGLTNLVTNPAALSDLSIAAASSGTLTLPGGLTVPSQAFLLSAVSNNTNVNVLSSPTILTTDNEEAEIIVGENVPFVTSTSTNETNLTNTFNQIEREDVGITLRITPQISAGNFVNLKIFIEISSVVPATRNDANGPTTTVRTTDTDVEVKSGQMIVTGGLISEEQTQATRGVPFLKDIPVFGQLFRTDSQTDSRTNLLVFITPKIVKNQYDARDSTVQARARVTDQIEYLEMYPDRSEILFSDKIDNVFESTKFTGELPSTIRPGKVSVQPMGKRDTTDVMPVPLKFKASPKFEATSPKFDEEARSLALPEPKPATAFVILKEIESGNAVGLALPYSSHFEIGGMYNSADKTYACLGVFSSKEEASSLGESPDWKSLNVAETIKLDKSWVRR